MGGVWKPDCGELCSGDAFICLREGGPIGPNGKLTDEMLSFDTLSSVSVSLLCSSFQGLVVDGGTDPTVET